MPRLESLQDLDRVRDDAAKLLSTYRTRVLTCRGTGCAAGGSGSIFDALQREVSRRHLEDEVKVGITGCHGLCEMGPLVVIYPDDILYTHVTSDDVEEIVDETLVNGRPLERLLYKDPTTSESITHYHDIPFYGNQMRIVLVNCGIIDPENIEEYIARDGYAALAKVLTEIEPEDVIEEVKDSGLRGRGGAGFQTGLKWEFTARAVSPVKYVVCNADEGDPGAFMDRSVGEGDPHSIIEGMAIAAYAIGAQKGFIYCRAEYPLAVERLKLAIEQATAYGLLGQDILGSGFDFEMKLKEGAGAFVCGEETALLASIEGRRGEPRPRPPFPAVRGLWDKPTVLNNVKSFATVPQIILKGADWFAGIGTKRSTGTAIFALTGNVRNTGLVEVPMGITLREIIFDIGGGIPGGREFKAVQTGGPLGGCLPADQLDVPVDFDSLRDLGAVMGSGGMIVVDDQTCMVEFAKFFLEFATAESCGKCVPCRMGGRRMLEVLTRITEGKGEPEDLDKLRQISEGMEQGSLCALGQLTPGPVLASLRYFEDEFRAHVDEKRCPALQCPELVSFYILPDKCQGCGICLRACPVDAIVGGKRMIHIIDEDKCIKCGTCMEKCPARFDAIVKLSGERVEVPAEPVPVGEWSPQAS